MKADVYDWGIRIHDELHGTWQGQGSCIERVDDSGQDEEASWLAITAPRLTDIRSSKRQSENLPRNWFFVTIHVCRPVKHW